MTTTEQDRAAWLTATDHASRLFGDYQDALRDAGLMLMSYRETGKDWYREEAMHAATKALTARQDWNTARADVRAMPYDQEVRETLPSRKLRG